MLIGGDRRHRTSIGELTCWPLGLRCDLRNILHCIHGFQISIWKEKNISYSSTTHEFAVQVGSEVDTRVSISPPRRITWPRVQLCCCTDHFSQRSRKRPRVEARDRFKFDKVDNVSKNEKLTRRPPGTVDFRRGFFKHEIYKPLLFPAKEVLLVKAEEDWEPGKFTRAIRSIEFDDTSDF